jgi:peptidoglycan/LPS O-acetylase OafA/YrhL
MPDLPNAFPAVTESATSPEPKAHLPALDRLRALASLFVFNVHAFGYALVKFHGWTDTEAGAYPGWTLESLALWLHRSWFGVDLFFVLSGFLMARQFAFAKARPGAFLSRRAWRILPAYVLALVLAALARWAVDGTVFDIRDWLANFAFLHGFLELGLPGINPVTWSMSYEVAFYLVVPLVAAAFARARHDLPVHAALAAAVLALILWRGTPLAHIHGYAWLFLVGIAMARVPLEGLRGRTAPALAILAWFGFVLAVKFMLVRNRELAYYLASMLGSGGLLLLALNQDHSHSTVTARILQWIGDRSYSLFLLHSIVVYLLGAALGPMLKPMDPALATLLFVPPALLLSLLASDLSYRIAERPYFRKRQSQPAN